MLSENDLTVSENTIPKKRGRPSVLTPEQKALIEKVCPELKTVKSLQNKWFRVRAVRLIREDPDFKWLYNRETHYMRETILAELGRVEHDADLLTLARELCELKPTSREAVQMIRNWRFRKDS